MCNIFLEYSKYVIAFFKEIPAVWVMPRIIGFIIIFFYFFGELIEAMPDCEIESTSHTPPYRTINLCFSANSHSDIFHTWKKKEKSRKKILENSRLLKGSCFSSILYRAQDGCVFYDNNDDQKEKFFLKNLQFFFLKKYIYINKSSDFYIFCIFVRRDITPAIRLVKGLSALLKNFNPLIKYS